MAARIPNLELLLYKAQQALAHDPDFVQKIAEIKENDSRKKVYLDFSVECFSQIWGSTCTGFDVTEAGEPVMAGSAMTPPSYMRRPQIPTVCSSETALATRWITRATSSMRT